MLSQPMNALGVSTSRLLDDVRRRLVVQRLISCLAWAMGAIFAVIGLSRLFGLSRSATLLGVGILALPGLVLILLAIEHVRRFSSSEIARLIDGRLNSAERISTATETVASESSVSAALHAQVESLARATEAVHVAPLRTPTRGSRMLAVGVAILAVGLVLPSGGRTFLAKAPSLRVPVEAVSVDSVLKLAEQMEASSAERSDQLLGALAGALRELASEPEALQSGRVSDMLALDDLMSTLAKAMGSTLSGADLVDSLLRQDDRSSRDVAAGAAAERSSGVEQASGEASANDGSAPFISMLQGLDPIAIDPEGAVFINPEIDRGPGGAQASEYRLSQGVDPMARPGDQAAGEAAVIGASEQSNQGDSALAGRGSQPLRGAEQAEFTPDSSDLVPVLGQQRDEGRKVEVQLSPTGAPTPHIAADLVKGPWSARNESLIVAGSVPLRHREAVGNYFDPSQETRLARGQ